MKYDVTVIGSGPGGYVAAIRCAQLGMKTAIVEKYNTLGGTCLNVGCIPSKALLDSSEHYFNAKHHFKEHGIDLSNLQVNLKQMIKRKGEVVQQTVGGIDFLMKKNKIDVFQGLGSFIDKNTILVKGEKEEQKIETDKVIIATGSKPASLPFIIIDKKRVITSTEALNLTEVPKHVIVIGGGAGGLVNGNRAVKLKLDPRDGTLSTHICPPISSTMRLEIVSPSPVPPYRRVVEPSACVNSWNRRAICSGVIPMPVSRTVNCSVTPCASASFTWISSFT